MPNVNISPVIIEYIMVTKGPVKRTALRNKSQKHIQIFKFSSVKESYPAKNINRNQLPGTANIKIASSVSVSPIKRKGIQAKIKRFDIRNIALAGA